MGTVQGGVFIGLLLARVVSGAVALMLEANNGLTPGLVKAILQYTAQPIAGANLLRFFDEINDANGAPTLQAAHFDRSLPWAMLDAAPYVAAAEHVWRCMFDAVVQKGGCLRLDAGHIGKWLALRGVPLPVSLGMVLVDEAHDLSPAWKQLLATPAPGVVSLAWLAPSSGPAPTSYMVLAGHAPLRCVAVDPGKEPQRRAGIEPVIGHMKADGHLDRCYLKGQAGDAANAVLSAVGYNFRRILASQNESGGLQGMAV